MYLRRIREVALRLDYLLSEVVFVGGAVVALYADDPAADELRPTDDIDIIVAIYTHAALSQFEDKIRVLGFRNVMDAKFIGRYKINEIIVDVMPIEEKVLGFSNKWYKAGMDASVIYDIDGVKVRLMPFCLFIASKMEAYLSRGKSDMRTSKDFEDIVYSFDNRIDPLSELQKSSGDLREYLKEQMNILMIEPNFHEGVYSHLSPRTATARLKRIKGIWSAFTLDSKS